MFAHMHDRGVANRLSQQDSNDRTRAAPQHRLARTVRATENSLPQRPCANGAQTPPAQAGKSRDTRK